MVVVVVVAGKLVAVVVVVVAALFEVGCPPNASMAAMATAGIATMTATTMIGLLLCKGGMPFGSLSGMLIPERRR